MSKKDDELFDAADRGRYRPPILEDGLSYDEVEQRFLKAIGAPGVEEAPRTLMQLKAAMDLPRGFDLTPVIEGMCIDRKW